MIPLLTNPRLLFGVLAAVALLGAYQAGGNAERKRGEAMQLRVELETARRDQAIAEQAADSADLKAGELAAAAQSKEDELDALRKQLAARPDADRSLAPADALDRLYPHQ
jgi:hypothetical protein